MGVLSRKFNPFDTNKNIDCTIPTTLKSQMRTRMVKLLNIILILYCITNIVILQFVKNTKDSNNSNTFVFKDTWSIVFTAVLVLDLFFIMLTDIGENGVNTFLNKIPSRPRNFKPDFFFDIICKPETSLMCSNSFSGYAFSFTYLVFGIILIVFGIEYGKNLMEQNKEEWKAYEPVAESMGALYLLAFGTLLFFSIYCPYGSTLPTVGSFMTTVIILGILFLFIGYPVAIAYEYTSLVIGFSCFIGVVLIIVGILFYVNRIAETVVNG